MPAKYPTTSERVKEQWTSITTKAAEFNDIRNGCSLPTAAKDIVSINKLGSLKK